MRRPVGATCLACAIVLLPAVDAAAQMTAGVAVGISNQAAGTSSLPSLGPGFGGTAAGIIADLDRPFRRHFTIGVEASTAGAISGEQSQRTSTATSAFTSHHRDSVFSGTFKLQDSQQFKFPLRVTDSTHCACDGMAGRRRQLSLL